jgi:hypothetical protein
MNLRDKCKELDISLSEGKELYSLTHWKQEVVEQAPEIIEALEPIVEDVVEAVVEVVKVVADAVVEIVSKEDKLKSIKGLGTKSPYWSELRG